MSGSHCVAESLATELVGGSASIVFSDSLFGSVPWDGSCGSTWFVVIGGFVGSSYGSRRFSNAAIKRWLALVLVIGALRLFLEAV